MKRRMVKRLRQLNLTGPRELFGRAQLRAATCREPPTTKAPATLPGAPFPPLEETM